jgi:signal transduction histidine kinase
MVRRLQSLSYRTRLLGALLIVNIPIFVLLSINEIVAIRDLAFLREVETINTLGQFLANEMTSSLIRNDSSEITNLIGLATQQPQITGVSLLDITNTVIASSTPALVGRVSPSPEHIPLSKTKGAFYLKSFIVHGGKVHGKIPRFLQVNFSLVKARSNIATTLAWETAIDAIEILIILFVAWFISGILQKPLVEMRDASNKMATGDFSHRVRVRSDDVIGRLATAFNNMSERLHRLTNNMQEEITRATGELTERNRELHEKQAELEESNRMLKELDVLKSDFVSMVSHELRTPLTSIIGFAKTLKTLPLSGDQQKQYLDIIESEGKRLSSLVEEYLDISKIESGNISLQCEPTNLAGLIHSAVDSFSVDLRKSIVVDLPSSMPDVMADAKRIVRVLYNIIDNAITYSGGSKEIIITAYTKENGVAVGVRDFGPGIAPDDLGKIFDKFYRGKSQATAQHRGSGLGLAIAKGIVEAHNGKIWCESAPGKGSKFTFFLPVKSQTA